MSERGYSPVLLLFAALAAGAPQLDGADTRLVIPIVLSLSGLGGSFYTSELTLTNRGGRDAAVTFTYTAAVGGCGGTGRDVLPAGRQMVVPDAVEYLRSRGVPLPDAGDRGGTLGVTFSGLASPADVAATVRTTTLVPDGRAGLAYPGLAPAELLTGPAFLCGLRENGQDRSNLALVNAGTEGDVTLRVVLYGEARSVKVLPTVTLPPGGFQQLSEVLAQASMANGYARVDRVGGSAPYYAYAVVNDQANSDGSFVKPLRPEELEKQSALVLPVVVEAGAFASEVVLTNFSGTDRVLDLDFVAAGLTAPGGTVRLEVALAALEQKILPGFVQYLRDRGVPGVPPPGSTLAGAVDVAAVGGDLSGIAVAARTAAAGGGGRYGLFYAATPVGLAIPDSAWLFGLKQDGESRTNLALVNTGETGTDTFRIELFDGTTGVKVASVDEVAVGPRGWTQIGSVLSVHAPGTRNAYARVSRTAGASPFLSYAVVNDGAVPGQRSGDGAFVAPDLGCVYDVSRIGGALAAGGGAGSVAVVAPAGCLFTAVSDVPWLSVLSVTAGATGRVAFSFASNPGGPRAGTLTIAGERVTVSQAGGSSCSYSLSAPGDSFEATGGKGSVQVSATAGCSWTASKDASWISITSGASGVGDGTVAYAASANSGPPRQTTLTIAGQPFVIAQADQAGGHY